MGPSPQQLLIIALIILLLFGATRLSEIGKGLGEGIKNFKKGLKDDSEENKLGDKDAKEEEESNRLPPRAKNAQPAEEVEETDDKRA